jgi:hypothetical protein
VNAPWAAPGTYTVRLTANGATSTQPLVLRMDPRVKTSPAALARVAKLSRELYDDAVAAHGAGLRARALATRLDSLPAGASALKLSLDSLAAAPTSGRGARRRASSAGTTSPTTLEAATIALLDAAMAMQAADVEPTASQLAAADKARALFAEVMGRWSRVEAAVARERRR